MKIAEVLLNKIPLQSSERQLDSVNLLWRDSTS